jgi:hypothetical protein
MVGAKRRHLGLSGYPDVTVAQARERAREARDLVGQGIDPIEHRRATTAALVASQLCGLTFGRAMEKFLVGKLAEFDNEKHRKQWRATLDKYAVPKLGGVPVDEISVQDIQRVLEPIWLLKTETANRLRGRIEAVLAWAAVSGHRTGENPARWRANLDAVLPKPSKVAKVAHHPARSLLNVTNGAVFAAVSVHYLLWTLTAATDEPQDMGASCKPQIRYHRCCYVFRCPYIDLGYTGILGSVSQRASKPENSFLVRLAGKPDCATHGFNQLARDVQS